MFFLKLAPHPNCDFFKSWIRIAFFVKAGSGSRFYLKVGSGLIDFYERWIRMDCDLKITFRNPDWDHQRMLLGTLHLVLSPFYHLKLDGRQNIRINDVCFVPIIPIYV